MKGKTVGVDATTLEANAAMRSIERRDTGESYEAFVRQLAKASGIETPTRAELARFDRSRKDRKTSNKAWQSPQDRDAKIAKMKDGRTHARRSTEDLETGATGAGCVGGRFGDAAGDADDGGRRSRRCSRTARRSKRWSPTRGRRPARAGSGVGAVGRTRRRERPTSVLRRRLYGNRRRIRGDRGRRLQRRRGELVERPFAHQYETGGLRRVWVRGRENVRKRVLIQAAGCNLGQLLRRLTGVGTPRSLQGRALSAICGLIGPLTALWGRRPRTRGDEPRRDGDRPEEPRPRILEPRTCGD